MTCDKGSTDLKNFMEQGKLPTLDVDWLINSSSVDRSVSNDYNDAGHHVAHNISNANITGIQTVSDSKLRRNSGSDHNSNRKLHDDEDIPVRKIKSIAVATVTKPKEKKHGFFRCLFGAGNNSSKNTLTQETTSSSSSMLNDTGRHEHVEVRRSSIVSRLPNQNSKSYINNNASSKVVSEVENPKLLEFIQFYKANGFAVSSFKNKNYQNANIKKPKNDINNNSNNEDDTNNGKEAIQERVNEVNEVKQKNALLILDTKGRPIPLHPETSRLPPAIRLHEENIDSKGDTSTEPEKTGDLNAKEATRSSTSNTPTSSHRFGAFLTRVTSHTTNSTDNVSLDKSTGNSSASLKTSQKDSSTSLKMNKIDNSIVVPGLENLEPLKHVAFATNTYFDDPPQQISSRNPRKGEVEVNKNGALIIHRLTQEEKKEILKSSTSGIVVGGSGKLRMLSDIDSTDHIDTSSPKTTSSDSELEANNRAHINTNDNVSGKHDHESVVREATEAASKRANINAETKKDNNDEDEVDVSKAACRITIDKPLMTRHIASKDILSSQEEQDYQDDRVPYPPNNIKIPHDVVYTRCCHLREILPLPATLKQLTKGSTDPIHILQLRNPHPSMIEILSFSDFISIAPIICLSLDGVHLSADMLRIILSSLTRKTDFEKLSLRNTPLDDEGWKMLCYFISKSKSLNAIDLTMVPTLKTNVQKLSKNLPISKTRMEYNPNNRSELNWDLLTVSVASKGGLEEIIISGSHMSLEQFINFIEVACITTERLGLAYNKLSNDKCKALSKWLVQSEVTGLDIGYNDLRGKLSSFSDAIWNKIHNKGTKNVFKFLSLNGTNLKVSEGETSGNNEVLKLLTVLCYSEHLKFLDISNNPKMFPYCMRTLINCLPAFVNLVRLHLDCEHLTSADIVMLSEVLPLCSSLNYLSMKGTDFDIATYKSITEAVKKSSSLITLDINYDNMSEKMKDERS